MNIASRKLREQNSLCSTIVVFIETNRFKKDFPQYSNSAVYNFITPTDYTPDIIEMAHIALSSIYKDGYEYKRAGVMFTDLTYKKDRQFGLFEDKIKSEKKDKIIKVIDKINKYGNYDIIKPAAYAVDNSWQMKRVYKSPNYYNKLGRSAISQGLSLHIPVLLKHFHCQQNAFLIYMVFASLCLFNTSKNKHECLMENLYK